MHPSSFHFGFAETILFKEWQVSNWQGMLGSALAITLLAALYESLKYIREYLHSRQANKCVETTKEPSKLATIFSTTHATQTFLVAVQVLLGNMLMLVSMTYNVYLCIALIAGATLTYFLLFWRPHSKRVVINVSQKSTTTPEPVEISTPM